MKSRFCCCLLLVISAIVGLLVVAFVAVTERMSRVLLTAGGVQRILSPLVAGLASLQILSRRPRERDSSDARGSGPAKLCYPYANGGWKVHLLYHHPDRRDCAWPRALLGPNPATGCGCRRCVRSASRDRAGASAAEKRAAGLEVFGPEDGRGSQHLESCARALQDGRGADSHPLEVPGIAADLARRGSS